MVRVAASDRLSLSFHLWLRPEPGELPAQVATLSVWGAAAQADIARAPSWPRRTGKRGSALSPKGCPGSVFPTSTTIASNELYAPPRWGGSHDIGGEAFASDPLCYPDRTMEQAGPFIVQVKLVSNANAARAHDAVFAFAIRAG